jgi:UMF1 family MFS transporter
MNRKHVAAWASYDFANSIYPAVVTTAVFNYYYAYDIVAAGDETLRGTGDIWWGNVQSVSMIIVALSAPLVGAIADRAGIRKQLLVLYTVVSAVAVAGFGLLEPGMVIEGFLLAVVASVGFEGALVFYNAYLPDIADRGEQGRVSGLGFAVGYLGSAVGLAIALPFASAGSALDEAITGPAAAIARAEIYEPLWLLVGGFMLLFALPTFFILPNDRGRGEPVGAAVVAGVREFHRIFRDVWSDRELRRFLLAFFFYIDGVLTVIVFAGNFAYDTLDFTAEEVVILFFVVQLSALVGAVLLGRVTDSWGPKRVVNISIVAWIVVGVAAFFVQEKSQFFVIAVLAGFNLGSIQAASRSFMSALIPEGKESEMFGFYAFCGKTSAIIGPFVFSRVSNATGNQRWAVLAITSFFLIGGLLLQRVRDPIRDPSPAR